MEAATSAAATAGRFDEHSYLDSGFPVRVFMTEPTYLDVLNISSIGTSIPAVGGPAQNRPNHKHTNSSSSSGELAQLQKQMMLEMAGGTSSKQQQQQQLQTGVAGVVAGTSSLDNIQASQHQEDRGSSLDGGVVQLLGVRNSAADGEVLAQPEHIVEDPLASAMAAKAAATAAHADAAATAAEDVVDNGTTDGPADKTTTAAAAAGPQVPAAASAAAHTAVHKLTINPAAAAATAAATAAAAAAAATGHPKGLKVDITSPGVAVTTPGFRSLQGLVSPGTEELQGCCAALMMLRDLQHPDSAAAAEVKELVPKAYAPGNRGGFRAGAAAVTAAAAARAGGYLGHSGSSAGIASGAAAAAAAGRLAGLVAASEVQAGVAGAAAAAEVLQEGLGEEEQQLQLALRRGKRQRKPQRWGEQLLMLDQLVDDVVAESHSSGGFNDWEQQRHVTWQQPPLQEGDVGMADPAQEAEEPEDDAGDASYDAAADGDAEMLDYEQEMEIEEEGVSHHGRRSSSHRGTRRAAGADSSSGDYYPAAGGGSTAKSGRRRKRGSSGGGGARLPKARKIKKGAKPLYDNDGAVNDGAAREYATASSYLGVSKKRTGKWQAAVRFGHDGAYAFWCCYTCPKTAARARDAAALALRGPGSARLNFPEDSYSDDELLAAAAQILAKHPHLHSHLGHPLVADLSLTQVLAAGGLAAAAAGDEDELAAAAAAAVDSGEVENAGEAEVAAEGFDAGEDGAAAAEIAAAAAAAAAAAELEAAAAAAAAEEETAAAVAEAAAITSEAAGTGAAKQQLQPRRTRRRSAAKKSKSTCAEAAATEADVDAVLQQPPAEVTEAAPVVAPVVPVPDAARDTAALFSRVFDLAALVVFGAEAATETPATAFSNEELAAAAAAMSCRMPLALQQQQLQQQLDACQQQQQQQALTMGAEEQEQQQQQQQQAADSEEKAVCIVTTPSVVKGAAGGSSNDARQQKAGQRATAAAAAAGGDQDDTFKADGASELQRQQQQQLDGKKQQPSSGDEVAAAAKPAASRAQTSHQQYSGCGNLELQQPQLRTAATAGC